MTGRGAAHTCNSRCYACALLARCGNDFCRRIPDDVLPSLCRRAKTLVFKRGDRHYVKDAGPSVYIVKSGAIAVLLPSTSGKSQGIFVAGPGSVMNVQRIAGDTKRFKETFNTGDFGIALMDSQVCSVPVAAVREALDVSLPFARLVMEEMTDRHKETMRMLSRSVEKGVDRITALIDDLETAGVGPADVTHETIGLLLGMNRVSVSRLMHEALEKRENASQTELSN